MVIAPALVFGLLVVFLVAAGLTFFVLGHISEKRKGNLTFYLNTMKRVETSYWTESRIEKAAFVVGSIAVLLVIVLMIVIPVEWRAWLWYGLTAIGIIFGFATFVLFRS